MMQDVHMKFNPGLPWQEQDKISKLDLNLWNKLVKHYIWSIVLKCCAGQGYKR